jgi:hypothetical protein
MSPSDMLSAKPGQTMTRTSLPRLSDVWSPDRGTSNTRNLQTYNTDCKRENKNQCFVHVMDPDPVASENFKKAPDTDPQKIIPNPDSSGSEMNLNLNYVPYSEKLIKFYNFLTKILNLKI